MRPSPLNHDVVARVNSVIEDRLAGGEVHVKKVPNLVFLHLALEVSKCELLKRRSESSVSLKGVFKSLHVSAHLLIVSLNELLLHVSCGVAQHELKLGLQLEMFLQFRFANNCLQLDSFIVFKFGIDFLLKDQV